MAQIVLGILIGAGAMLLIWVVTEQRRTIKDLLTRVTSLEACNRKRMPYAAQDELLDAMAVLDRLTMDADVMNAIRENVRGHIANALQVGTKPK